MTGFSGYMRKMTAIKLIVLISVFLILSANMTFFSHVLDVYPLNLSNALFLLSLCVVFSAATIFLLSLLCYKYTIKPVLILVLLISSAAAYFMDSYNTIIDDSMIQNIMHTDMAESLDLFSFKLVFYVVFIGLIPSFFVYKSNISFESFGRSAVSRLKFILITLLTIAGFILIFSDYYASFFREHKPLRYYSNPSFYMYSAVKHLRSSVKSEVMEMKQIGLDAKIVAQGERRKLIIFVVGETARADRFSLNGYERETNPLLKAQELVNFPDFWSCGTSTAISVPCMFSVYGAGDYDKEKVKKTENVLDVLKRAGVDVLWLDNNSSSKGVAERVEHESFKSPELNDVCDTECRDVGMLSGVQSYIDKKAENNIFIILHQMGNHGPAYYKRYPADFEVFKPVCKTNQLETCSTEEINNAYDNAILYTDYFLSRTIELLNKNSAKYDAALFYVSDHGESLGENNLYLHGLPNFIAPDTQRHVSAFLWFDKSYSGIDADELLKKKDLKYSHDNVFHTILGLFNVNTSVYDNKLDIVYKNK